MSAIMMPDLPKIDLEDVLHGDPAWEDVVEFFQKGDFCEVNYHVKAIKRWLLTAEQKQGLVEHDLTISDILTGNYGEEEELFVYALQDEWNQRLGVKAPNDDEPDDTNELYGIFQQISKHQLDNVKDVLKETKMLDFYSNALGVDLRRTLEHMQSTIEVGQRNLDKLTGSTDE